MYAAGACCSFDSQCLLLLNVYAFSHRLCSEDGCVGVRGAFFFSDQSLVVITLSFLSFSCVYSHFFPCYHILRAREIDL